MNGVSGNIIGQGVSTVIAGTVRIPALMTALASVTMTSELVLRGLGATLSVIGFEPKHDSWIDRVVGQVNHIRPYKNTTQYPTLLLARYIAVTTIMAIVTTELANVLVGPAPACYNNVLSFMGPIRLSSSSYLEGVHEALYRMGLK